MPQDRVSPQVHLTPDGRNIAEFLRQIAGTPDYLNRILKKLERVLPYISDLQPKPVSELERKTFLEMKEKEHPAAIPGWLFSSGSLHILTLLALFNNPSPPSVLFIEEKEVVQLYGVWGKKKLYGKEYEGTHRMSFLIDPEGKIVKMYEKVKPEIHAEEVLRDMGTLSEK